MSIISDALIALCNNTKKVEYPNFPYDLYVRPLTVQKLAEIQIEHGDKDEDERIAIIDTESNAYSLCDKDGNQIFTSEEYIKFTEGCPLDIGIAIMEAKNSLNDFEALDLDAKKK